MIAVNDRRTADASGRAKLRRERSRNIAGIVENDPLPRREGSGGAPLPLGERHRKRHAARRLAHRYVRDLVSVKVSATDCCAKRKFFRRVSGKRRRTLKIKLAAGERSANTVHAEREIARSRYPCENAPRRAKLSRAFRRTCGRRYKVSADFDVPCRAFSGEAVAHIAFACGFP